jgi:NAD+ synthase (glutamine-hydrolysing)
VKIALAQIDVIPNRPLHNVEQILSMAWDAIKQGNHLIAAPEMAIKGYLVGDKWLNDEYCRDAMEYNTVLQDASAGIFRVKDKKFSADGTGDIVKAERGIAIAYGNIFLDEKLADRVDETSWHPNEDGRVRRYNGINIFQHGEPVRRAKPVAYLPEGFEPKTLLPNYRIFDDKRFFHSLLQVAQDFNVPLEDLLEPFVIDVDGKERRIGLTVCEDLYIKDYRKDREPINVSRTLIEKGAEAIINCSTSPWTFGKVGNRDRQVAFLAEDCNAHGTAFVSFYYVNPVGAQNNGKNIVPFDGASTIYGEDAQPKVIAAEQYKPQLISAKTTELRGPSIIRHEKPKIGQKLDAIIAGMKHLPRMMHGGDTMPKIVIGASGGIDSSVALYVATKAAGAEKVLAVNMPTSINERETIESAELTANALGLTLISVPITDIVDAVHNTMKQHVFSKLGMPQEDRYKLTKENIQAKIRGTDNLSNIAAFYGGIFTNNGNKNEILRGYATLYGDVGGAIAILGDLTKAEVFALGQYINEIEGREVISTKLFPDALYRFAKDKIPPKAALDESNRVDPIKFGYECALIDTFMDYNQASTVDILKCFQKGSLHTLIGAKLGKNAEFGYELMQRWNMHKPQNFVQHLEEMAFGLDWAVFKHIQTPPLIMTGKNSFGSDYRESILPHELTRSHYRVKDSILAGNDYEPRSIAYA